jgi:CubicO group peptidase (beta-lactamase class C family)
MPRPALRFAVRAAIATVLATGKPLASQPVADARRMTARLDSLFTIMESHERLMGTVTVRRGGRVLYQRSIGYRDSVSTGGNRADRGTAYRAGSLAKPFTATLIYQLRDQGRLSLETPLARFFPALPASDSITIRHLLGHTSGLGDHTAGLDLRVPITRDSILRRIAARPRAFRPGTQRRYNNSGYWLLGEIASAVTGTPLHALLDARIAKPLGLTRTRFGGEVAPARNEARAFYFTDGRWTLEPDDAMEIAGGAGALVTTSDELTRFLVALFAGRLLSPSSLFEMTNGFADATRVNGKGLSPFFIPGTEKTGYSHDGSMGAFTAMMGYVPADSVAVAFTLNGHNYPQRRLFFHIWDIVYGSDAPLPSFAPMALSDSLAQAFVGAYGTGGLVITVRTRADGLEAQTTGQDSFPLTYIGARRFVNVPSGILIEFAEPQQGRSPRFTLFQQKAEAALDRRPSP